MTSILAVTLARGGSRGCLHKHIRPLRGKPVLEYTIEAVQKSKYLNDYVVSSDDYEILSIANSCGVDTINRPVALAMDETPTMPALQHAVETYERRYKEHFDYIVEVRATSPLKTADDIDGIVKLLLESGADSVIGVTELEDHHPARAKWIDIEGRIRDFIPEPESGRRQDLHPKAYIRNGTVYALTRQALDSGKLFGHKESLAYVMPAERSINIDTEMDFRLCQLLLG
jgi:CMP-N,N'-diacetyllegionaminic acid synthase